MTAGTRPYAELIGDPVEQSLSPAIHGFWLGELGIEADYRRRRLGRGELDAYLDERRSDPAWRGCNVTMPLKLDALAHADEASDRALGTGGANLLLAKDGRTFADNTDVGAVMTVLGRLAESGAPMRSITLLGSGGAARAALTALHLLGLTNIRIQSRDMAEAYKLAVQHRLEAEPMPFDTPIDCEGLINATPLGMAGYPQVHFDLGAMPGNGWVLDFVSNPDPTELVSRARARGLAAHGGLSILIEQAADSFKLLFRADAPRDKDAALRHKLKP